MLYAIQWKDKSIAHELYRTHEQARLTALAAALWMKNQKMKALPFEIIEMVVISKKKS